MNNTVIGIAVLDRTVGVRDFNERLIILCQYADGSRHTSHLPVRAKGVPGQGQVWEYEIKGDTLAMTPSVKISTTRPVPGSERNEEVELFHNEGQWSIPFREFNAGEYVHATDLFRHLNGLQKTIP